jgi:hypothetical protein
MNREQNTFNAPTRTQTIITTDLFSLIWIAFETNETIPKVIKANDANKTQYPQSR